MILAHSEILGDKPWCLPPPEVGERWNTLTVALYVLEPAELTRTGHIELLETVRTMMNGAL